MRENQKSVNRWPIFHLGLDHTGFSHPSTFDEIPLQEAVDVLRRLIHDWLHGNRLRPHKIRHNISSLHTADLAQRHDNRETGALNKSILPAIPVIDLERQSTPTTDWSHIRERQSLHQRTKVNSKPPYVGLADQLTCNTGVEKKSAFALDLSPLQAGHFSSRAAMSIIGGNRTKRSTTSAQIVTTMIKEDSTYIESYQNTTEIPWRDPLSGDTLRIHHRTGVLTASNHHHARSLTASSDIAVNHSGTPLLLRKRPTSTIAQNIQRST